MVRLSSGLAADQEVALEHLARHQVGGQPTKLSTTNCSPFDAEMALRDVPRSMPTLQCECSRRTACQRIMFFSCHWFFAFLCAHA